MWAGLTEGERIPKLLHETICPSIQLCGATVVPQKAEESFAVLQRMNSCSTQCSLAAAVGPLFCGGVAVTYQMWPPLVAACWAKCSQLCLGFG